MTRKRFFSLRLPFGIYVHYAKGRKIGQSRSACDKGFAHYNRRRRLVSKTIRSFFGEPNHYDPEWRCIGYSRRTGLGRVTPTMIERERWLDIAQASSEYCT